MTKKRVLFISQECKPFLPESEISNITRTVTQGVQEAGKEIRIFLPRYGVVNERRHQLHEVIRLSGINLSVNDIDHPLIIKVASVPSAKMQAYFIDNEDYFSRKATVVDKDGNFFEDNDERSIFFCRGVIETIKKLGWIPDVIHCHGWMTALFPLYFKKYYAQDSLFDSTKVVYSAYSNSFDGNLNDSLIDKIAVDGIEKKHTEVLEAPNFINLNKIAFQYADGIIEGSDDLDSEISDAIKSHEIPSLTYQNEEERTEKYNEFYDNILSEDSVLA